MTSAADCYIKADSPDIQPQAHCNFVRILSVVTPLSVNEQMYDNWNDPRACLYRTCLLLRQRCVLLKLYFQCTREDH